MNLTLWLLSSGLVSGLATDWHWHRNLNRDFKCTLRPRMYSNTWKGLLCKILQSTYQVCHCIKLSSTSSLVRSVRNKCATSLMKSWRHKANHWPSPRSNSWWQSTWSRYREVQCTSTLRICRRTLRSGLSIRSKEWGLMRNRCSISLSFVSSKLLRCWSRRALRSGRCSVSMRCTRCCLRLKLSLNYWSLRPSLKLWSKN